MYKKLGILGGMGPLATCNFYKSIIDATPAKKDQDHIDMVILNASGIPDRTQNIISNGQSPVPYLADGCRILENAGCDVIAIPCNTAHYFYEEIKKTSGIKILNMIDLVAQRLAEQNISTVFLMATEGTISTGVYEKYLSAKNIEIMLPDKSETAVVMKAIYEIKAGITPNLSDMAAVAEKYYKIGCKKIILGCTELPLIKDEISDILKMTDKDIDVDELFIDSTDIMKDEILKLFGKYTQ